MSLEKLNIGKPPDSFTHDQDGNSRLVFDLLLAHKWWREKSKDESKYSNVTLNQLEDYALTLEREIERRDIKLPVFNDDMPTIRKVWSESAREAALEARRAKANPPEPVSGRETKLRYAFMPRATIDRVKKEIASLPPEHTEGVKEVHILRNAGSFTWTNSKGEIMRSSVGGDFNKRTGVIRIGSEEIARRGGSTNILYHEYGHNVWDHTEKLKRGEWSSFWNSHMGEMPNSYSRQRNGWQEGFAECYMRYQSGRTLRPDVESWFKSNVKRGTYRG